MEDPALNRNLEETTELHARWGQFHDFFTMAIKAPQKINPQAEMKFLELKTRIAMLHDGFMQSLKHDHKVGQQVLDILRSCIMLKRIPLLSNAEVQKLEFDWNEAYLLMTETISTLQEERERLLTVNERVYKIRQARDRMVTNVHNFFSGPYFRALIILAVVGFVIVGVPMFGIYDYTNLKDDLPWTAPVYDRAIVWVRLFNPEVRYLEIDDVVNQRFTHDIRGYGWDDRAKETLTPQRLIEESANMGFAAADFPEVRDLIQNRLRRFDKEVATQRGTLSKGNCYYLLFQSTADARRFVELRRQGMAKLSKRQVDNIDAIINVARKANFVGVFASDAEVLRIDFARDKWAFKDAQLRL